MDNENPQRRPGPVTGAALGLAAAVAALGAGESAALATGPATSPVVAVGAAAVDLAPTALKEYAVREFGTHDKAVLLAGVLLTTTLLALAAGVLTLRRPVAGAAVFGAFGLLGGWAALSRPAAAAADCGPSLVAGAVGALAAAALARLLHAAAVDPPAAPPVDPLTAAPPGRVVTRHLPGRRTGTRRTVTRRTALAATAGTFAAGATAGLAGRLLAQPPYDTAAVRVPPPARPLPPPLPAVHPNVAGLSPFTTPNGDFYRVDTALTLPRIDPRSWALRIHGLVDRPQLLTFDDLLREPLEELDHTLSCVSNEVGGPYVGTARWLGASLPALLRRAGVRSGADQLVGRSKDGMTIGTPLESVLDGRRALLAVAMNGEALPPAHGFPCRSVVPGFYGYTSATKWLIDLEVTTFTAFDPYWVRRGWDRTGTVRTASRIEVPAPFAKVPAGPVDIAGTAWATHRGIAAVELRIDQGPWQRAELAADAGPDLWRQWSYAWTDATPGTHRIEVRATDATGAVQPERRADPFPAGATGWHSTVVTVH